MEGNKRWLLGEWRLDRMGVNLVTEQAPPATPSKRPGARRAVCIVLSPGSLRTCAMMVGDVRGAGADENHPAGIAGQSVRQPVCYSVRTSIVVCPRLISTGRQQRRRLPNFLHVFSIAATSTTTTATTTTTTRVIFFPFALKLPP